MTTRRLTIISHNDMDGMTSAVIAAFVLNHRQLPVTFHFVDHGPNSKAPDLITEALADTKTDIAVLDFCPPVEILKKMRDTVRGTRRFYLYDHHASALDLIAQMENTKPVPWIRVQVETSCAKLLWDHKAKGRTKDFALKGVYHTEASTRWSHKAWNAKEARETKHDLAQLMRLTDIRDSWQDDTVDWYDACVMNAAIRKMGVGVSAQLIYDSLLLRRYPTYLLGWYALGDFLMKAKAEEVRSVIENGPVVTLDYGDDPDTNSGFSNPHDARVRIIEAERYASEIGNALVVDWLESAYEENRTVAVIVNRKRGTVELRGSKSTLFHLGLTAAKMPKPGGGHRSAAGFTLPLSVEKLEKDPETCLRWIGWLVASRLQLFVDDQINWNVEEAHENR